MIKKYYIQYSVLLIILSLGMLIPIHKGIKDHNACFSSSPLVSCLSVEKSGFFWTRVFAERAYSSR